MGNRSVSAAAKLLFPRHTLEGKDWQLDVWGYRHFTQQDALPIPGFDSVSCHGRCGQALTVLSESSFSYSASAVTVTRQLFPRFSFLLSRNRNLE